jgi:excisionase family DNA binding protein
MLRPAEVADRLDVDVETVLAHVHRGTLPAVDVARPGSRRPRWRISEADLDAFVAARRTTPRPPATKRRPKRGGTVIKFF